VVGGKAGGKAEDMVGDMVGAAAVDIVVGVEVVDMVVAGVAYSSFSFSLPSYCPKFAISLIFYHYTNFCEYFNYYFCKESRGRARIYNPAETCMAVAYVVCCRYRIISVFDKNRKCRLKI
jgi:hypothetical protein